LSGVFSLRDAIKLVTLRGKLTGSLPGGAMLSVPLGQEELKSLLNQETALAAVNTSSSCVISGAHGPVKALTRQLKEKGINTRLLHTSHAFHSKMMDPILKEFAGEVRKITLNRPKIPYISNVTGKWITIEQAVDPGYWANHLRGAVCFAHGINELLKEENSIFIEVGPGKTLCTFFTQHESKDKNPGQVKINMVKHPNENAADDYYLLSRLGELWLYGKNIDWAGFYTGEKRHRIPLPTYPFEGKDTGISKTPIKVNWGSRKKP
jgi:acyl transferase domain-containing protein